MEVGDGTIETFPLHEKRLIRAAGKAPRASKRSIHASSVPPHLVTTMY